MAPSYFDEDAIVDSGTETDDEEEEDNLRKDMESNSRCPSHQQPGRPSSTPVYALGALELKEDGTSEGKENVWDNHSGGFVRYVRPSFIVEPPDGGNNSSEEELEEINKSETPFSESEFEEPELLLSASNNSDHGILNGNSSTPGSSDEELVLPHNLPQFSTSPPTDAHRPRRSSSPPAAFRAVSPADALDNRRERRAISPRKRYRQSRVHHIQRPCLDFEKMQQLKTRAVTSWRHGGGELSLFCW